MAMTRGWSRTIWMFDIAHQETPNGGRRFVVVTLPYKEETTSFREESMDETWKARDSFGGRIGCFIGSKPNAKCCTSSTSSMVTMSEPRSFTRSRPEHTDLHPRHRPNRCGPARGDARNAFGRRPRGGRHMSLVGGPTGTDSKIRHIYFNVDRAAVPPW
ncbi:hypothetical protein [Rhizobium lentis]|uniref:hypothetical protein n=1 Tax=Rhizobium lentis TaxID=1138194 RepID=UPI001C8406DC|nr:hypothetical protein [Rhizobium lentis]MBX4959793.1 hypothetical protein [Rhizobium lentis]MBX4974978.1 hypothetical protein [Rhizobium lentis]MBX4989789.1 hypothetical protein [Rhizobium lentis]MBX5008290.1 hypothetical protein [Rhizobium lentis]MBX5026938.1 hypothetical protein [Rhizobium lentis]